MSVNEKLYLAIYWHMHQPYYRNKFTGECTLPWVRLHCTKDYYDMPALLESFPSIHQTFNLVPSLMDQIEEYACGGSDRFLDLSKKPAEELSLEDKIFILHNFFMVNWDNMVEIYPRYSELLRMRGYHTSPSQVQEIQRYFTPQDLLDLQVWFNLSWFDPFFQETKPFIKSLIKKDRGFTEEEKIKLLEIQKEIVGDTLSIYKKLQNEGIIEVTTTPYYHPILPLLIDTDCARTALPRINLPANNFSHPEDAEHQIRKAIERYQEFFGQNPRGFWPSEGSVSEEAVLLLAKNGVAWIGTDEGILTNSLGVSISRDISGECQKPTLLYQPYFFEKDGQRIYLVFRDHTLSDLFGFIYSKWDAKDAVEDFIKRLKRIKGKLPSGLEDGRPPLVSIILDGENAWEYYKNDGRDFLMMLYDRLSSEKNIVSCTVSEYLEKYPPRQKLPKLFAGSWINSNFAIWIGHEEDNTAWDLLSQTRNELLEYQKNNPDESSEKLQKAWEEVYIAEGSDWCWWFGEDHYSGNDEEFDNLFREHLKNVYYFIDKEPPNNLYVPVLRKDKKIKPLAEPRGFITPTIDGEITSYYEWISAGHLDVTRTGGTMHQARSYISDIYYGFNLSNFYLRLDTTVDLKDITIENLNFSLNFLSPHKRSFELRVNPMKNKIEFYLNFIEDKKEIGEMEGAALDVMEICIPFKLLEAKIQDEVQFLIVVKKDQHELERWPQRGYISFFVPGEDFERIMWQV